MSARGLALLALVAAEAYCASFCSQFFQRQPNQFFPLRHCQRSNGTTIGFRNFDSAEKCADFARQKRGMAFNFGPPGREKENLFETMKNETNSTDPERFKTRKTLAEVPEEFYNCQVLECPENGNFSSMINDTRFDYYSLYTNPPPFLNSTCLPGVGIFILDNRRQNHVSAKMSCDAVKGSLAHIASEARTNGLSGLVRKYLNETIGIEAYVGLNETIKGLFNTSADEPLSCFTYRAWSPGQPTENRRPGCVGITRENSWKVFNCRRKMASICEIHTSQPVHPVRVNATCHVDRPNNRVLRYKF